MRSDYACRQAEQQQQRQKMSLGANSGMPNPYNGPQPPGRFSFGTQQQGGPQYSDAFKSRPSPSATQLVENYGAILYAMVARNRDGVSRLPMRLMADGSRAQGGKPGRAVDPIRVSRRIGERLARAGQISSAAVDQVYEIRNHPLLDVINNPDPYGNFTREQFIGLMCSYMDVVGSAYLVPEGNGWDWKDTSVRRKGPPEFLWMLYPQYTIPIRLSASPIVDHFMYFADWIPRSSAIWFRHNHSLRDAYGSAFSPTNAGEPYRKQEQEQVAILSQVLGIGPRPNMIASAKDPMMAPGKKEKEALEIDLINKQAAAYAGGILVTTGAFDWTPVSYSPADLGGNEIAQQDIYNLASIFGQPPTYYTVDSNLANLQAADQHHARFGIEPRCNTIASVFTECLAKPCDDRLFFQFDSPLPEDDLVKAQVEKIYVDMGAVTLNQLNEEKKFPAVPWGDEPWLSSTLKQPSMIQAEHQMAQTQAASQIRNARMATDFQYSDEAEEEQVEEEKVEAVETRSASTTEELAVLAEVKATVKALNDEIRFYKNAGNPHHDAQGHFTDVGHEGHAAAKAKSARTPGEQHAKNRKKPKKKKYDPRDASGRKQVDTRIKAPSRETTPEPKPKDEAKSERAKLAYEAEKSNVHVVRYGEAQELNLLARIGGVQGSNNGPVDVVRKVGGIEHGLEVKTLINKGGPNKSGSKAQIKMEPKQKARKEAWLAAKPNRRSGIFVMDHRDRAVDQSGNFIGNKESYSGHELYYRRDYGAHRIGAMYKVRSAAEAKTLLSKSDDELREMVKSDPKRYKGLIGMKTGK
jgi:hypothetical protein